MGVRTRSQQLPGIVRSEEHSRYGPEWPRRGARQEPCPVKSSGEVGFSMGRGQIDWKAKGRHDFGQLLLANLVATHSDLEGTSLGMAIHNTL